MSNWALYALTVVIWGSTWIGIKYQLGTVDPMVSVGHRFALSAAMILCFLLLRQQSLRLSLRNHGFVALQGLCLFCGNYVLLYHAELTLASGLVAVVFSTIVILNIVNSSLFLGQAISARVVLGAVLGMLGMAALFWPELQGIDFRDAVVRSLLMCLGGTVLASLGNMVAVRNQRAGIPVLVCNGWGMLYGATTVYLLALLRGVPLQVDTGAAYLVSLAYLALFGSVIAFWAYITLMGRIGADRAGYSNLLFPVVALAISTAVEGYQWTLPALLGLGLVIAGNWLVMRAAKR